MADNKQLPPTGTGTANIVVATDEIAGVDYQKIKLVDGTADSTTAAKVSSEGNLQTITPNRTASGTLGALNDAVTIDTEGMGSVIFVADATTLDGSVAFEGTVDGSTWFPVMVGESVGGAVTIETLFADIYYSASIGGCSAVRIRVSAYTSGSATVQASANQGNFAVPQPVVLIDGSNVGGAELFSGGIRTRNYEAETSLDILDDWDESDRAKVNPIVGQAGVQGAAGISTANTQRVAIATDANAISGTVTANLAASSNNIGDVDVLTLPADPLGANADAIVAAGAAGSISAKLRRATQGLEDLKTGVVLAAGNNNVGDVDVASIAAGDNNIGNVDLASAIPAGTNNIGDVDVLTLPADPLGANADAIVAAGATGSISAKLRRATQGLEDLKTGIVLAAGSAAIGKLAANSGVDIGDVDVTSLPNVTLAAGTNTNEVVGDIAHDTGVGGNPVLIAGAAQDMDDTAPPNRVSAESDTTRFATDRDGVLFAHPHGPQIWSYHEDSSSALTDATVHAAPSAGLSLYVTDIVVSTGAATALNVFFEEGASKVLGPYYLEAVAGRGLAIHFGTPKKITAATALTVTTSAAIAHSIDVTGFVGQG